MKRSLQLLFLLVLSLGLKAQQNYFVYVQTDNKQPFYVKVNDKVLSSSASGYVVIPKLTSGNYSFTFGFPKDIFPEQSIALAVGNADAGYLLKNFGDKGWGLYNIQSMAVTMAGAAVPKSSTASGDDVFSNALSGAANTTITTKPAEIPAVPVKKDAPAATAAALIQKISSSNDAEGRSMVYIDRSGTTADTVRIFIPAVMSSAKPANNNEVKTVPAKDQKFLDMELPNPNAAGATVATTPPVNIPAETKPATTPTVKNTDKPTVTFNSDCRANAGDDDFLKIRKKMAAETDEDAMVSAAGKFLKAKCYSTEQIKNLSTLFLTDAGKYKFFDAAYPHTFDTQNFSSLQSQLKDEYYVTRFKAMVRN